MRNLIRVVFSFMILSGAISLTPGWAAEEFRGITLPENWQQVMETGYALEMNNVSAGNVCEFFQKTLPRDFFCSVDIRNRRISIQKKAPFHEIFEDVLNQLGAGAAFGEHYVFIAKQDDPGLKAYPQLEDIPRDLTEGIALEFRNVRAGDVAAFMTKATNVPVEIAPSLQSRRITILTKGIPLIEAAEVIARYLQAPLSVHGGRIQIG